MQSYEATITIDAPTAKIWSILTDTANYPEWDPYAIRIEGSAALGESLKAYTTLSPDRAFPVKVTSFEANKKMVWTGGMPLGLFKGERSFTLKDMGTSVDFSVKEIFTGPLLPLFARSLPDMTEPFQAFVKGLYYFRLLY